MEIRGRDIREVEVGLRSTPRFVLEAEYQGRGLPGDPGERTHVALCKAVLAAMFGEEATRAYFRGGLGRGRSRGE